MYVRSNLVARVPISSSGETVLDDTYYRQSDNRHSSTFYIPDDFVCEKKVNVVFVPVSGLDLVKL